MRLPSAPRPPLALSALFVSLALLLPACGGGGGGGSDSSADDQAPTVAPTVRAQTAIYFTDDFSAAYDAVWISVSRITVISPAGETELMRYDTPRLLNLPTLRRTGALMATAGVPVDATEVRVYVAGMAQLQQLDGSMLDVALQAPAGYLGFRLEGWDSRSGALALDFDLPNFSLQGNALVAATRLAGSTDLAGWNSRHTEVKGTVTAVSTTSLTLQTVALGVQTFSLDAQTTFLSERSAGWMPVVGSVVELYSSVAGQGAQALQFSARQVKDRSDASSAASAKVHGVVSAVANGMLTLSVDRSSLAGATGSIQVDVGQASYKRGSAALLAPGLRIEAYLVPAAPGSGYSATVLEIEGAAKVAGGSSGGNSQGDDNDGNNASDNSADRGYGEVKGAINAAGLLQAVKVELEGGCASAYPVSGVPGAAAPSTPVAGIWFVDAKGLVTAVRAGEFDLQVYKIEYAGAAPATLTVRHGAGTLFKRLSGAQLAAGQFVEIKGTLQGALLDASKIERD